MKSSSVTAAPDVGMNERLGFAGSLIADEMKFSLLEMMVAVSQLITRSCRVLAAGLGVLAWGSGRMMSSLSGLCGTIPHLLKPASMAEWSKG